MDELETKLAELRAAIFADAMVEANVSDVVLRHCRRRIDRALKQIDLSAGASIADLAAEYARRTAIIDVAALASEMQSTMTAAIAADDLPSLLAVYDRKKPLLALASSHLRNWKVEVFTAWVTRAIRSTRGDRLRQAILAVLPPIKAA